MGTIGSYWLLILGPFIGVIALVTNVWRNKSDPGYQVTKLDMLTIFLFALAVAVLLIGVFTLPKTCC